MKAKTIFPLGALIIATLVLGAMRTHAATTNLEQDVWFSLVFYEQGPTNPAPPDAPAPVQRLRVTTKDIIAAIGAARSIHFSAGAGLLLVSDMASTNGSGAVVIQDGLNTADVSEYFTSTNSALVISGLPPKAGDRDWPGFPNNGGQARGTRAYSLWHMAMTGPGLQAGLDLSGLADTSRTAVSQNGVTTGVNEFSASVAGTGSDLNGVPALVQGTVAVQGGSLVVQ